MKYANGIRALDASLDGVHSLENQIIYRINGSYIKGHGRMDGRFWLMQSEKTMQ